MKWDKYCRVDSGEELENKVAFVVKWQNQKANYGKAKNDILLCWSHYSVECLTITSTRKIWDRTNQHIHNFVKFLIT